MNNFTMIISETFPCILGNLRKDIYSTGHNLYDAQKHILMAFFVNDRHSC